MQQMVVSSHVSQRSPVKRVLKEATAGEVCDDLVL